ncbi:Palmitoyltransferase [[Candida] zeylanoides]
MHNADGSEMSPSAASTRPTSRSDSIRPTFLQWFIYNWLITDPALHLAQAKNYQVQNHADMNNVYFLGGRLRSIKDKPLNLLTGLLIFVPAVLFWCYEARWMWRNVSPALVIIFSYLWLITALFFIKAGTSDPGMLPRNIHLPMRLDPATRGFKEGPFFPEEYLHLVSLPHYSGEHEQVVVKYCHTCHVWRPPRASHCQSCSACVVHHDHHCKYLSNCVGAHNYRYFLWFLLLSSTTALYLSIVSFLQVFHYRYVAHPSPKVNSFRDSLNTYPASFFLAIYALLGCVYPFLLLGLHVYLTASNLTTREYLNNIWGKRNPSYHNVFDTKSVWRNLYINWLGKPRGISFMRPTAPYEPGDMTLERVNAVQ